MPKKCFPWTYDLNGFKSRINRHLLIVGFFYTDFWYALIFLCFFSHNSVPYSICPALLGVNPNKKSRLSYVNLTDMQHFCLFLF